MRFGCNLVNGKVEGSKVGCVLAIDFKHKDGASFISDDAYGHLCTNYGSKWQLDGRYFDGDDYVDCGNASVLRVPLGTLQARFKPGATDVARFACGIPYQPTGWTDPYVGIHLGVKVGDLYGAWININATNREYSIAGATLEEVHLAHSFDGTFRRAYLNGDQKFANSDYTGTISYSGEPDFAVGVRSTGNLGEYWLGLIKDCQLHNFADYSARILERAIEARRS